MATECTLSTNSLLLMREEPPRKGPPSSGWTITCVEDHDHGAERFPPLLQVALLLPSTTQFFALPVGAAVYVLGPGRVRAHVYMDGKKVTPSPGSYLDALTSGKFLPRR
jgi:hypothetical protein